MRISKAIKTSSAALFFGLSLIAAPAPASADARDLDTTVIVNSMVVATLKMKQTGFSITGELIFQGKSIATLDGKMLPDSLGMEATIKFSSVTLEGGSGPCLFVFSRPQGGFEALCASDKFVLSMDGVIKTRDPDPNPASVLPFALPQPSEESQRNSDPNEPLEKRATDEWIKE